MDHIGNSTSPAAVGVAPPHTVRHRQKAARVLQRRGLLFVLLAVLGAMGGLFIYLPLLIHPDWLKVSILGGSILHNPKILFATALSEPLGRGLCALVMLVPLLASSRPPVRRCGLLILISVMLSAAAYGCAFVSVRCCSAALLSAWLGVRLAEHLGQRNRGDRVETEKSLVGPT
jgi:hypothetical protein